MSRRPRLLTCAAIGILLTTACGAVRLVPPDEARARADNLDFEDGTHAGGLPNGWNVARGSGAGSPDDYTYRVDTTVRRSGRASLMIKFRAERPDRHGGIGQCVQDPELGGRRLRLAGYIMTADATGEGASLWIEAFDISGQGIALQNMDGRRVRGTTDWRRHALEVDLGGQGVRACFGFFLDGEGTAWADDLSFTTSGGSDG